ncbi:alpha/beta fold hydrolase [Flavihumibacter petaseus]|uniref:Proline iminopeptidase n=1 Tax=Flavihumibacter petaseus NBRC 106054 TaxID=1220578 RepID=A0A0E9N021_9BACT|nr:alpha/beta hydrolase [Flavihumibacter petaseus]GAO43138.1 peptidase S33 family protein [Flavihumibacter petaseus NBRC 106054]
MSIRSLVFFVFLAAAVLTPAISWSQQATSENMISEENFIAINGIEQWVTIKGDRSKPVILFLHGGPGSVMSPYADHIYKDLEKEFVLVQWDQRGAGRTYGKTAPDELTSSFLQANPLTIDQMAADGITLAQFLCQYLGKQKIILFGTSWGSALGVTMVTRQPDLFYAWVGHSQIVNPSSDSLLYEKVLTLATRSHDTASLNKLREIEKPPYSRARTVGQLWRIVKKYERENSAPAPKGWFTEMPGFDNAKDSRDRENGDDYSFVNFVGDQQLKVSAMRRSINFAENNLEFKVPVYLIQGEADLLTPAASTRQYFDKLKAPHKEYVLLPNTAHGFNQAVVDAQVKIFRGIRITDH